MYDYERDVERRNIRGDGLAAQPRGDKPPMIVGYAAVFNTLSEELFVNGRRFREIVRPGAFAESLRSGADILARFNHNEILGRTANGTLRLTEDERGLRYEIDPPETQAARDLIKLIRRRDVVRSSFAFRVVQPGGDRWRRTDGGEVRELVAVTLIDVSPVVAASYSATSVDLRAAWRGAIDWMKARLRIADAEIWQPASAAMQSMASRLRFAGSK